MSRVYIDIEMIRIQTYILNSKKAVSPILATLLLVVIAVAAIVVTYAWIMTCMSSAENKQA